MPTNINIACVTKSNDTTGWLVCTKFSHTFVAKLFICVCNRGGNLEKSFHLLRLFMHCCALRWIERLVVLLRTIRTIAIGVCVIEIVLNFLIIKTIYVNDKCATFMNSENSFADPFNRVGWALNVWAVVPWNIGNEMKTTKSKSELHCERCDEPKKANYV